MRVGRNDNYFEFWCGIFYVGFQLSRGGLLSENCAVRLVRARTMTRGSGEAERRGSRNGTIGQKQLQ